MKKSIANWTKDELKTYLLIYCANADFSIDKVEIDYIKSKVGTDIFDKINAEFEKDNDYQSIQKIQSSFDIYGYSKDESDDLINEIKELFLSDEHFDSLEQNLYRGLSQILK